MGINFGYKSWVNDGKIMGDRLVIDRQINLSCLQNESSVATFNPANV